MTLQSLQVGIINFQMKLATLQLFQPQCHDYSSYLSTVRQVSSTIDPEESLDCYEWLIHRISELPFQQSESLTLITLCMNNLGVGLAKYEFVARKVLKFVRKSLLRNGQSHCQSDTHQAMLYINHLNLAKIHLQLANYAKAFVECERALKFYEVPLFKRIKELMQISDVMLLLNGYIMLAKAFELAEPPQLKAALLKSELLQKGFNEPSKFLENAKKVAQRYLGQNHPMTKKISWYLAAKTSVPMRFKGAPQVLKAMDKRKVARIIALIQYVKSLGCVRRGEQSNQKLLISSSQALLRLKTEDSTQNLRKLRLKQQSQTRQSQARKSYDEDSNCDQTVKETQRKSLKQYKLKSNVSIEHMINSKVDEKLKSANASNLDLDNKYNKLVNEVEKMEKEKQNFERYAKEWQANVTTLQEEIVSLKKQIAENEKTNLHQFQQEMSGYQAQIKTLNEQNQLLQKMVKNPNFIHDFQQNSGSMINSPPFSFNKLGNQCTSEEKSQKSFPNTGRTNQFKPHKSLSEVSVAESDESLFVFLDNLSQQAVAINLTPNVTFRCKIFLDISYTVEVTYRQRSLKDGFFVIKATLHNKKELEETIEASQMREFLQFTQNYHNIPFPAKLITDFKSFVQYLLIPFIQIQQIDQQEYKLAIYPFAQGICQEFELTFFSQKCNFWVYYLSQNTIRIAIYTGKQYVLQYDVMLSQMMFEKYFDQVSVDEYQLQECLDLAKLLESANAPGSSPLGQLIQERSVETSFELPSVIFKHKGEFEALVGQQLTFLEKDLGNIKIKNLLELHSSFINQELKIVFFKYIESKSQAYYLFEDNGVIQLRIKHCFQTHFPKGQMGFAEGLTSITDSLVHSVLGIELHRLDLFERNLVLQNLSELFTLQAFFKPLDKDDEDMFQDNLIQMREPEYGGYQCIFTGDTYKIPIRFQLIGIENKPQFVRVDAYNDETVKIQGILFHITPNNWLKVCSDEAKPKKRNLKYKQEIKMTGDFLLSNLLKWIGWTMLTKPLVISQEKQLYISLPKQEGQVSRIESFLSFRQCIEHLNK